ncbi:MAG: helix-turn-helix domain-containing protein [Dehalococcoidia bacterium]
MDDPQEIKELQKKIVTSLEKGTDPAPLLKELSDLRAKIASNAELAVVKKIADERQRLRDSASQVQEKVKLQSEAIDTFLKLRDSITTSLKELLEQALPLIKLQSDCYIQYHNVGKLAWMAKLPNGYLPEDLTVPFLTMGGAPMDPYDASAQAFFYLRSGHGLLVALKREERPIPKRLAGEFEAIDNDPYPDPPCSVCQHPEKEAIDKAIKEGVSLRDIADKYGPSKSTLSRHKAHMEISEK